MAAKDPEGFAPALGDITFVVARHAHRLKERWLVRELAKRGVGVHDALAEGLHVCTELHPECYGWGVRIKWANTSVRLVLCDCLQLRKP